MKILVIARGIPNVHDPQEGCFEWDQAKALATNGHKVVLMAVDGRVRNFWRPLGISQTVKDGITAYKLFYFPTSIIRRLISFKLGYGIEAFLAKRLYKYIIKSHGDFDIIHAHFLPCIYYGSAIKRKHACKLVGTEHWSELDKKVLSPIVNYLGRKTYTFTDGLISVSRSLQSQIMNNFDRDCNVIYNMVDSIFFKKSASIKQGKQFKFVCVGSLIERKGFDLLIESFSHSKARYNDVQIIIIGDGPEKSNLQKLIDHNLLSERIFLVGQKDKEYIHAELLSADAFILPSRNENFSVSVLEALASGLPVIATICGGIEECIDSSNGILVPVNDAQKLSEAIDYIYTNILNYDSSQISADCMNRYSSSAIVSKIEELYSSILFK